MAITIMDGVPGTGKSLYGIQGLAIPALKKDRKVITNIENLRPEMIGIHFDMCPLITNMNMEIIPFSDIEKTKTVWKWAPKNSLIIIDEAQKFFGSKMYQTVESREMIVHLMEHRHFGQDFVFITPHVDTLDANIKRITQLTYRHKAFSLVGASKTISMGIFDGADITREPLQVKKWTHDKKVYECYSSYVAQDVTEKKTKVNVLDNWKLKVMLILLILIFVKAVHGFKTSTFFNPDNNISPIEERIQHSDNIEQVSTSYSVSKPSYISIISFGDSAFYRLDNGLDTVALLGSFPKAGY